jgi:hypothetical protein
MLDHCSQPATTGEKLLCSSPRFQQLYARNVAAYQQLNAQLNPGDQAELLRRLMATSKETHVMCYPGGQQMQPPLPPSVEDCLARRADYVYGELQRGLGIMAGQAQQRQQNPVGNFFQNLQNNMAAAQNNMAATRQAFGLPAQLPIPQPTPIPPTQYCNFTYGGGSIQGSCQ